MQESSRNVKRPVKAGENSRPAGAQDRLCTFRLLSDCRFAAQIRVFKQLLIINYETLPNENMLKIKIAVILFTTAIAGDFVIVKTSSQTRTETKQEITKSTVVIEKARTKCNVEAYRAGIADDKLKTSVVRAKPDKNSSILKTVTTKDEVVFYISGSSDNGWFEISKIESAGGDVDETLFEGRGWVHSSLVDLSVANGDAKLYAEPKKKSRVLKKLVADQSEARPVACQGNWMKIKSGKSTGWLSPEGQCANPLTTCS